MRILSLDYVPLDCSEDGISLGLRRAKKACKGEVVFTQDELEYLVVSFSGVTEGYWRLASMLTGDAQPWRPYMEVFRMAQLNNPDPVWRARAQHAANACRETAYLASGGKVTADSQAETRKVHLRRVKELFFLNLAVPGRGHLPESALSRTHDAE